MHRTKPPPSLDGFRAQLDAAGVRRLLLPHEQPVSSAAERSLALNVPLPTIVAALIAEADGDLLAALVPGSRRLDTTKLCLALGARRVRLATTESLRRRIGQSAGEVPILTGLPTVMDKGLLALEYLYASTGDALWSVRLAPIDVRRITGAIVADLVRSAAGAPTG